jgi:hypothetical protein
MPNSKQSCVVLRIFPVYRMYSILYLQYLYLQYVFTVPVFVILLDGVQVGEEER